MSDINPAQLTQAGNINNTALYNTQGQNSTHSYTHLNVPGPVSGFLVCNQPTCSITLGLALNQ